MLITYDPKIQGDKLTSEEIKRLSELNPKFVSFTTDEPELTEELLQKMRISSKSGRFSKASGVVEK